MGPIPHYVKVVEAGPVLTLPIQKLKSHRNMLQAFGQDWEMECNYI